MSIAKKVASRRLKKRCIHCGCGFRKGNVYYLHREVFECDGKVYSNEHLECAKCNYKRKDWERRYEKFKEECNHPDGFVILVWGYMTGEAVMQPDYDLCTLCGDEF